MIELVSGAPGKLVAEIRDELGSVRKMDLSSLTVLGDDARVLMAPIVLWLNRTRFHTQVSSLVCFARIARVMAEWKMTALPDSSAAWQKFLHDLYEYWLTRVSSKARLRNRVSDWNQRLAPGFELLRDSEDVIPVDVLIPRAKRQGFSSEATSDAPHLLLGQSQPQPIKDHVDKLLVSVSIARTDARYLEEIRDSLSSRRHVLDQCFRTWWEQIEAHYVYGQELLGQTDWLSLSTRLGIGKTREWCGKKRGEHIANGATEESLGNLLAILTFNQRGFISKAILTDDPHLPVPSALKVPPTAPPVVSSLVTTRDRINWMLGNLSQTDIAIAVATLILHNPRFTPISTLDAKLFDKHGRKYLEVDGAHFSFRVEKHRARAVKISRLNDSSLRLIETVVKMTERTRNILRADHPRLADQLFFVSSYGKARRVVFGHCRRIITGSAKPSKSKPPVWIGSYFPAIEAAGLQRGSVSFSRIRHTEGVLEWFRTGSIVAVSKKLGNSQRVVLAHYLPRPLLTAWNTRQIRRFQNLWLAVAAAKEDFLLTITDFNSLEDLHAFMNDMLSLNTASSSPLAKELHERFTTVESITDSTERFTDGNLSIPVSSQTLLCLYLYQESALVGGASAEILDQKDVLTRIRPRQFLNLAELLRHQLPNHRDPRFREAHEEAIKALPAALQTTTWSRLISS